MIVTIQGERTLVTAIPGADGVRALVALTAGECAAGDAAMLLDMARELQSAAQGIERLRGVLQEGEVRRGGV